MRINGLGILHLLGVIAAFSTIGGGGAGPVAAEEDYGSFGYACKQKSNSFPRKFAKKMYIGCYDYDEITYFSINEANKTVTVLDRYIEKSFGKPVIVPFNRGNYGNIRFKWPSKGPNGVAGSGTGKNKQDSKLTYWVKKNSANKSALGGSYRRAYLECNKGEFHVVKPDCSQFPKPIGGRVTSRKILNKKDLEKLSNSGKGPLEKLTE